MIGLKINGTWLDMDPDTQIKLRLISPAFSRDIGDNSHSLSFSLPGSDHNLLVTGYYESPQVVGVKATHAASLYLDHNILYSGELDITLASHGDKFKLTCKFNFGLSTLAASFRETKLVDIDLGGQRDIAGVAAGSMDLEISQLVVDGNAGIKVNGFIFYFPWAASLDEEGILDWIALQINQHSQVNVDAVVSGTGNNASMNLTPTAPATLLDVETNPPVNEQQWTILNQSAQAIAIHDAMIAHMNTVAQAAIGTYDYTFIPVRNFFFYDKQNPDYLDYINLWDWDNTTFLKNSSAAGEAWRNTAIPFPRLAYLLDQALAHFGFTNISTFTF